MSAHLSGGDASAVGDLQARLAASHRSYLALQTELHERYLQLAARGWRAFAGAARADGPPSGPAPGRDLSRGDLERLADGRLGEVFGPGHPAARGAAARAKPPQPPLLLAQRVGVLSRTPGASAGGLVADTPVAEDAWYLDGAGRMCAGAVLQAGRLDPLLAAWLGVATHGTYRLRSAELVFHGDLPAPGETLRHEVSLAAPGGAASALEFSCTTSVGGEPRLSLRAGRAVLTDAAAKEVWAPEPAWGGSRPDQACRRSALSPAEIAALAAGDAAACFGPGFALARTHMRTPNPLPAGIRLLEQLTELDTARGYLRASTRLSGEEWFFACHFPQDPVMPEALLFEGCLQAAGVYLASLGVTLQRDGWRFAPLPGRLCRLQWWGEVTPGTRELAYELWLREVLAGDEPAVVVDVRVSADGVPVFGCRGLGVRLVPDWPLATRRDLLSAYPDEGRRVAGVGLDPRAILGCALGRPSETFGSAYRIFDAGRRPPRLPAPPFLFLTRVLSVQGRPGGLEVGAAVRCAYDVPSDAWYFAADGSGTMPLSLLVEAAVQPCGWLTGYVGVPLALQEDVHFRNLDGSALFLAAVGPGSGQLVTEVTLTGLSRVGQTVISRFHVECSLGGQAVVTLDTACGHFPPAALALQTGLPPDAQARARFAAPSNLRLELQPARDGGPDLSMLDRVTGWWPDAGRSGLGRMRAERDLDPGDWFFRAHFLQDPVQPGSLGLQAMLQLLGLHMLRSGMAAGIPAPRLLPVSPPLPLSWKYRGQVTPAAGRITVEIEVTSLGQGRRGPCATADGWLWVDGQRIYQATGLALEIVPGGAAPGPHRSVGVAASPADALRLHVAALAGVPAASVEPAADGASARCAALPLNRFPVHVAPVGDGFSATAAAPPELDLRPVTDYWRDALGAARWVGEDILLALLSRFVRRVVLADPGAAAGVRGRGVLFLANHQTAVESPLFATVAAALQRTPVVALAKAEHRGSWLGTLMGELALHPGVRLAAGMLFFDRADPASLLPLLHRMRELLAAGTSVLVHVEGTRALSCRERTAHISANLLEVCLDSGAAAVAVRFSGGLPVEPLAQRREFPLGFAAQDYHLGRPVPAQDLRALPLAERTRLVLDAINSLGPAPESEEPAPADPAFERAVSERRQRTGLGLWQAVVLEALAALPDPCPDTRRLLQGPLAGSWPDGPRGAWLEAFARRLHDPRPSP